MSFTFADGGGGDAFDPSSGMEMTVDEEAASKPPRDEDARSKLASSAIAAAETAAAGGVVAFSLEEEVVASSSSIEGQEGVDSSILLKRSFRACDCIDFRNTLQILFGVIEVKNCLIGNV